MYGSPEPADGEGRPPPRSEETPGRGGAVRSEEGFGGAVRSAETTGSGGAVLSVESTGSGGAVFSAESTGSGGVVFLAESTGSGGAGFSSEAVNLGGGGTDFGDCLALPDGRGRIATPLGMANPSEVRFFFSGSAGLLSAIAVCYQESCTLQIFRNCPFLIDAEN